MSDNSKENEQGENKERDDLTQSFPPSHILQDGRFIYLPEPTDAERSTFLERSIARHKIIDGGVKGEGEKIEDEGKGEEKKDATQPRVHPLAVASARLQTCGIEELSKAINLTGLASSGEYFGLSNIVNPMLENNNQRNDTAQKNPATEAAHDDNNSALRALYLGKRKREQFEWASKTFKKHEERLAGAVKVQQIVDSRLMALRPRWRLVAPEHGTRARAHATRPSEVVAIDVDVYDRDRTGGGNQALIKDQTVQRTLGRLARRVPRFATVELPDDYKVKKDVIEWKAKHKSEDSKDVVKKEGDIKKEGNRKEEETKIDCKTVAEPFAIADPTLGKIDVDFDPNKVPMLSLQFDIEKDCTGFRQCKRLMPLTTLDENARDDEKVIVALQHSLFCASLFESIRQELTGEEHEDEVHSRKNTGKQNHEVWLSCAMEDNFLPPASLMVGGGPGGRGALSVVYCHEGEVKVQLDSEYALTVKLVEAGTAVGNTFADENEKGAGIKQDTKTNGIDSTKMSGSQSKEQLHALCRALLLHAQDVYHKHSIKIRELLAKKQKEANKKRSMGLETKQKKDELPRANILQECVSLGVKIIFERKVRWSLARVQHWLKSKSPEATIIVEWLPLSIFDQRSQFVLSFQSFIIDVSIERDEMTVRRFGDNGEYRKVVFHTENEFEFYLRLELRKRLKHTSNGKKL